MDDQSIEVTISDIFDRLQLTTTPLGVDSEKKQTTPSSTSHHASSFVCNRNDAQKLPNVEMNDKDCCRMIAHIASKTRRTLMKMDALDFQSQGMNETGFKAMIISTIDHYYPSWQVKSEYAIEYTPIPPSDHNDIASTTLLSINTPKNHKSSYASPSSLFKSNHTSMKQKKHGYVDIVLMRPCCSLHPSKIDDHLSARCYDTIIIIELKYWRLPFIHLDTWTLSNDDPEKIHWDNLHASSSATITKKTKTTTATHHHFQNTRFEKQRQLSELRQNIQCVFDHKPKHWTHHLGIKEYFHQPQKSLTNMSAHKGSSNKMSSSPHQHPTCTSLAQSINIYLKQLKTYQHASTWENLNTSSSTHSSSTMCEPKIFAYVLLGIGDQIYACQSK